MPQKKAPTLEQRLDALIPRLAKLVDDLERRRLIERLENLEDTLYPLEDANRAAIGRRAVKTIKAVRDGR